MKVVMVCDDIYPWSTGGAEVAAYCLTQQLAKKNSVAVLRLNGPGSAPKMYSGALAYLPLLGVSLLRNFLRLAKERPDVVIANKALSPAVLAALYSRISGTKFFITVHNLDLLARDEAALFSVVQGWALRRASKIVAVSEHVREKIIISHRDLNDRIVLISNGIDRDLLSRQPGTRVAKQRWRIMFVGRLEPVKNPMAFLKVAEMVGSHRDDVDFVVIGSGRLLAEVKAESVARKLSSIEILGRRSHAETLKIMSDCDVLVATSETEGLPLAVLESLALGKPIVATAVGGIQELVVDGVNGYLVKPGQYAPENIAESLLKLMMSPRDYERLSANAVSSVAGLTWDQIAASYQALIAGDSRRK